MSRVFYTVNNFPKITKEKVIVFPLIETIDEINEMEAFFDKWTNVTDNPDLYQHTWNTRPKAREIYLYRDCMKPWFKKLYERDGIDKEKIVIAYGKFLRNTIINSAKHESIITNSLKTNHNIFSEIKFYFRMILLSFSEVNTEGVVIKFARMMGEKHEREAKHALSSKASFDKLGNLTSLI